MNGEAECSSTNELRVAALKDPNAVGFGRFSILKPLF